MSKFRRVVERTQPNYTVMRGQECALEEPDAEDPEHVQHPAPAERPDHGKCRGGSGGPVARNDQAKAALEKAKAENDAPRLAECKAAAEKAKSDRAEALKRFWDAAISQSVQTAVIAGLGILVKFILHRWDDLQDEKRGYDPCQPWRKLFVPVQQQHGEQLHRRKRAVDGGGRASTARGYSATTTA